MKPTQKFIDMIDADKPLRIELEFKANRGYPMQRRPCAEVFLVRQGLIFFDIGWGSSPTNAAHFIQGTYYKNETAVRGISDPTEAIKKATVEFALKFDPLYAEVQSWLPHRSKFTRKDAWGVVKSTFSLGDNDLLA